MTLTYQLFITAIAKRWTALTAIGRKPMAQNPFPHEWRGKKKRSFPSRCYATKTIWSLLCRPGRLTALVKTTTWNVCIGYQQTLLWQLHSKTITPKSRGEKANTKHIHHIESGWPSHQKLQSSFVSSLKWEKQTTTKLLFPLCNESKDFFSAVKRLWKLNNMTSVSKTMKKYVCWKTPLEVQKQNRERQKGIWLRFPFVYISSLKLVH